MRYILLLKYVQSFAFRCSLADDVVLFLHFFLSPSLLPPAARDLRRSPPLLPNMQARSLL